jgi:hypothetical protein
MVAIFYPPAFSAASDDLFPPADYLHAKLQQILNLKLVSNGYAEVFRETPAPWI